MRVIKRIWFCFTRYDRVKSVRMFSHGKITSRGGPEYVPKRRPMDVP